MEELALQAEKYWFEGMFYSTLCRQLSRECSELRKKDADWEVTAAAMLKQQEDIEEENRQLKESRIPDLPMRASSVALCEGQSF